MPRWLSYLALPVFAGLFVGLIWIAADRLVTSERPSGQRTESSRFQGPVSYADAVSKASPSVVSITTKEKVTQPANPLLNDPFFRRRLQESGSEGQLGLYSSSIASGVIMDSEGFILTNQHVIEDAVEVEVTLPDGRKSKAELVGSDKDSDLALLWINMGDLQPIPVGNSDHLAVGDVVLAIGNPGGLTFSVTQGIISGLGRYGLSDVYYEDFIQTDAAINQGNSGGALIDAYGNLIGINNLTTDQSIEGISFAIPVNYALQAMSDLKKYGRVVRGWLGVEGRPVSPIDVQEKNLADENGLLILRLYNNGPAHVAGIRVGDIITHIDGESVGGDGHEGLNQIAETRPGSTVTIRLIRNGNELTVKLKVGVRPIFS